MVIRAEVLETITLVEALDLEITILALEATILALVAIITTALEIIIIVVLEQMVL